MKTARLSRSHATMAPTQAVRVEWPYNHRDHVDEAVDRLLATMERPEAELIAEYPFLGRALLDELEREDR